MLVKQRVKRLRSSIAEQARILLGRAGALVELNVRILRIEQKLQSIEYFSHGGRATYVGNNRLLVKVVVANHNIAYYVEADDRLLTPWFVTTGGYETELTNYFLDELKPNSHCIDVGSNFGYFTCLMARFCPAGRVIGIEADEKVAEIARDNALINGFYHAEIINAAVSDHDTDVQLYRRNTRSGNTSIAKLNDQFTSSLGELPTEPFIVKGLRIDDLMSKMDGRVDFMKVDVEGAEPLVFKGAPRTIDANPDLKIVMEWSPGQIREAGFEVPAFLDDLREMHLRPFDIRDGGLAPLSFDELLNLPYRAGVVLKRAA